MGRKRRLSSPKNSSRRRPRRCPSGARHRVDSYSAIEGRRLDFGEACLLSTQAPLKTEHGAWWYHRIPWGVTHAWLNRERMGKPRLPRYDCPCRLSVCREGCLVSDALMIGIGDRQLPLASVVIYERCRLVIRFPPFLSPLPPSAARRTTWPRPAILSALCRCASDAS